MNVNVPMDGRALTALKTSMNATMSFALTMESAQIDLAHLYVPVTNIFTANVVKTFTFAKLADHVKTVAYV